MKYWKFYLLSVAALLAVSAYPIYMGAAALSEYIKSGFVDSASYPRYIIPYTPLCVALLIVACLMPMLYRRCKRVTLPAASLLGAAIFFACEIGLEQIRIVEGYAALPLDSWQYSLCAATPEVLRSIGQPIYAEGNPAYKLHFYLIALVILLAVVNLLYGYTRMIKEQKHDKKKPLAVQLACTLVFIGLCVFACFTAFYRNGTLNISALSAGLMAIFFIAFGLTFGVYFGCLFYGRNRLLSAGLPAVAASATTLVMYLGELVLMDGTLFRLGRGAFFAPFGLLPLSPADLLIIAASGALTLLVTVLLNRTPKRVQLNR